MTGVQILHLPAPHDHDHRGRCGQRWPVRMPHGAEWKWCDRCVALLRR